MSSTLTVPSYRAALLTNGDGAPMVTGPDGSAILTEKQWYLFWNDLTRQVNELTRLGGQLAGDLEGLIAFGLHADRPDVADVPSGALYFETDRSSLYQNHNVGWQYLAGTMYGTLSPDERPTGLDASGDAGFVFKTNVDPARTFVWNGGQWVETTPVRYDTHAERIAATITELVSGMLWVETDRSSVLYQNQVVGWQYIAGTMWGTLSPDQRPTDLGPAGDAGFQFRSTDLPARSFIWSGTAWVETTPPANSVQFAVGTGNVTLTATAQNIPGLSLTITRAGKYLVKGIAWLNVNGAGDAAAILATQIMLDGAALAPNLGLLQNITAGAGSSSATVPCECLYTHTGGTHTLTLAALKFSGTGTSLCVGAHSTISALWVNP